MYELQRWKRILWPSKYDHAAYMLINAVGRYWLLLTGWKREYRVEGFIIDLAHPRLKLAIEADGEAYHTDIVREWDRDQALSDKGWLICHYRYPQLKKNPKRIKREVRTLYYKVSILGNRQK